MSVRSAAAIVAGGLLLAGCASAAVSTTRASTGAGVTATTVANTTTTFTLAPGTKLPPGRGGEAIFKACAIVQLLFDDVASEAPFPIDQAQALSDQAFQYAQVANVLDGVHWHALSLVILDLSEATLTIAWSHGNGLNSNIITTASNDCTPIEAGKL
jgi:hypothetical protein